MKIAAGAILLSSLLAGDIDWHTGWQSAKVKAEKDRKLIVAVIDDPKTGCWGAPDPVDLRKFADKELVDRTGEFVWFHSKDRKVARFFGFKDLPVVAVVDSDGAVYAEAKNESVEEIVRAVNQAVEYYQEREIVWTPSFEGGLSSAKDRERLALVAFGADGEDLKKALKALEDRTLVKYHNKFIFIRQALDSDAAKKLKVEDGPSIVILDPTKEEAKRELGRIKGSTPSDIKPCVKAAVLKHNEEKEESR